MWFFCFLASLFLCTFLSLLLLLGQLRRKFSFFLSRFERLLGGLVELLLLLVDRFFEATQRGDNPTVAALSMVAFPDDVESWNVLDVGEARSEPYAVPSLIEAVKAADRVRVREAAVQARTPDRFDVGAVREVVSDRHVDAEAGLGAL